MKRYEKPLIFESSDLAEGVFADSGLISDVIEEPVPGTGEPPVQQDVPNSYSVMQTNRWDIYAQYNVTVTNGSASHVDTVTVLIGTTGTVTEVTGNIASYEVGNGCVSITFNNYGNGFDGGATNTFYVQVAGSADVGLV